MLGTTLFLWVGNRSQHATESIQTHSMHHSYQTARRISEGRWEDDSGAKPRPFHHYLPCKASHSPAHWFGHCCLGPPGGCYPDCLSCCQSVWTLQMSTTAFTMGLTHLMVLCTSCSCTVLGPLWICELWSSPSSHIYCLCSSINQ